MATIGNDSPSNDLRGAYFCTDHRHFLFTMTGVATLKIVSGGQTGVDRGALAAALDGGAPCGGWCPENRIAEDGVIPLHFPLQELRGGTYRGRTLKNVLDSDGTLIIFNRVLTGGSKLTVDFCEQRKKPYCLIDATEFSTQYSIKQLTNFLRDRKILTLNVAGPRASNWENGEEHTYNLITELLKSVRA